MLLEPSLKGVCNSWASVHQQTVPPPVSSCSQGIQVPRDGVSMAASQTWQASPQSRLRPHKAQAPLSSARGKSEEVKGGSPPVIEWGWGKGKGGRCPSEMFHLKKSW